MNLPEANSLVSLTAVECDTPHDAEVIADLRYESPASGAQSGDAYPSPAVLDAFAQPQCLAAFEEVLGKKPQDSSLEVFWYRPSKESWEKRDRAITCLAVAPEGEQLTSPLTSGK